MKISLSGLSTALDPVRKKLRPKFSRAGQQKQASPTTISRSEAPSFASSASSSGSDDAGFSGGRQRATPRSVLSISRRELEAALVRLGAEAPPEEEIAAAAVDDGRICLATLGGVAEEEEGELREAFAVFDTNADGRISPEELLRVLEAIGDDGCTLDDCRRMIRSVDTDGDGLVCFDDFARMMAAR